MAAPIRLSGGEISKLINGIVRALEASEFEERLARLEEKAMRQIDNRLGRLERQNAARRLKQVILWDDGSGSAQIEAAALEKEHGENIEIVRVGWLPAASATSRCAAKCPPLAALIRLKRRRCFPAISDFCLPCAYHRLRRIEDFRLTSVN